jgi:hypothetical protein
MQPSSPGQLFSPFDSGSPHATAAGAAGVTLIPDSVFGELVSEEERDEIVRSWEGVYARGKCVLAKRNEVIGNIGK